jgi:hypothetical protein
MTVPATDVATHLAGMGISLTLGTNLFTGGIRDVRTGVPKNAVFVKGLPGGLPERTMGEVDEIRSPLVSVNVRWTTFDGGDTKIRQIQEALQAATISGYIDVAAQQSEPLVLGQDNEGLHMFMMIFSLKYVDASIALVGVFSSDFSEDFL